MAHVSVDIIKDNLQKETLVVNWWPRPIWYRVVVLFNWDGDDVMTRQNGGDVQEVNTTLPRNMPRKKKRRGASQERKLDHLISYASKSERRPYSPAIFFLSPSSAALIWQATRLKWSIIPLLQKINNKSGGICRLPNWIWTTWRRGNGEDPSPEAFREGAGKRAHLLRVM